MKRYLSHNLSRHSKFGCHGKVCWTGGVKNTALLPPPSPNQGPLPAHTHVHTAGLQ